MILDEERETHERRNNLLSQLNQSGLIDNGWQKFKEKSESTTTTRTAAVTQVQTPGEVLSQSGGDTTLAGTRIRAGSFTAIAGSVDGESVDPTAQIRLLGVKESHSETQSSSGRSVMWQSMRDRGETKESLLLPDIQGYGAGQNAPSLSAGEIKQGATTADNASPSGTPTQVALIAPGGLTVGATDLPSTQVEAGRSGGGGNGGGPETRAVDLRAQAKMLAQQPGLAWLGELADRPDVDWQKVELINQQWDHKQSGLTQEGGAVIAIAVAIVTWGWGSALAGTTVAAEGAAAGATTTLGGITLSSTTAAGVTTYTAAGAALNAGFTTLATQASISLINNKGDIGKTLKELGTSDTVKQVVASMLTAGLGQKAVELMGLPKNLASATFTERFASYATKAAIGAGVQSAVVGKPLDEAAKTALVNTLAQSLTSEIGDWGKGNEVLIAKTLAHAVVQCAAANVQGNDCGSAALGAATAELLSPLLDKLDARTKEAGYQQTLGSAIAGMGAMLAAGLTGKDTMAALNAAQMVDYYNRQLHPKEQNLAKELAKKSGGKYTEAEIADALRWASNKELNEMAMSNTVVLLNPNTPASAVYDAQSMSLANNGVQAVLYQDLSKIAPPSAELMAYIQQSAGGTYSWDTSAWQTGGMPATTTNGGTRYGLFTANGQIFALPLAECPAGGCATSPIAWASTDPVDQAALKAYSGALNQQMLEDGAKLATVGTAISPIGLGRLTVSGLANWQTLAAFGLGAGFQTAGDYYKTGEINPVGSLVSGGMAALYAPLLTSSVWKNSLIGGTALGSNAMVQNQWLGANESVWKNYAVGTAFSGVGTGIGNTAQSILGSLVTPWVRTTPLNPLVPALLQAPAQPNPLPGQIGGAVNSGISNLPPFLNTSKSQQEER